MIKLVRPKAYGEIKPLCDSTGRPIRCTPPRIVIPEIEDRPDCTNCQTRGCRNGTCDGVEENLACNVACWPCDNPTDPRERTPAGHAD